jgi:hypothetical protein
MPGQNAAHAVLKTLRKERKGRVPQRAHHAEPPQHTVQVPTSNGTRRAAPSVAADRDTAPVG